MSRFKNYIFKSLGYIMMVVTVILLIIDVLFILKFKSPITGAVFASTVETNTTEFKSVMRDYWILSIPLILILTTINYASVKELKNNKFNILYSFLLIIVMLILLPLYRITISTNFF